MTARFAPTGKDLAIEAIGGRCMQNLRTTTLNDPDEANSFVSNSLQSMSSLVKVANSVRGKFFHRSNIYKTR